EPVEHLREEDDRDQRQSRDHSPALSGSRPVAYAAEGGIRRSPGPMIAARGLVLAVWLSR
ncbi:MAG TPA: hypothetical protein VN786_06985, partial [Acidimicrobiales bacterium]|nr:hypothetical protein [Acidimicrobiales bacterium]